MKTLTLTRTNPEKKIAAIKAVRLVSRLYGDGLGLKDAKTIVDRSGWENVELYRGAAETVDAAAAAFGVFPDVTVTVEEPEVVVRLTRAQAEALKTYAWGVYSDLHPGRNFAEGERDAIDAAGDRIGNALAVADGAPF